MKRVLRVRLILGRTPVCHTYSSLEKYKVKVKVVSCFVLYEMNKTSSIDRFFSTSLFAFACPVLFIHLFVHTSHCSLVFLTESS